MYHIYFQKQKRQKLTSESLIEITEIDPKSLFQVSQHCAHCVWGLIYNVHIMVHGLVGLLPSLGSCSPTNTLKIKTFPALSPEYIFPPSSSKISVLTCPRWSSISCFNCKQWGQHNVRVIFHRFSISNMQHLENPCLFWAHWCQWMFKNMSFKLYISFTIGSYFHTSYDQET